MTTTDMLLCARLCSAAYSPSDEPLRALGITDSIRVGDAACMALVIHDAERDIVVIQGTQATGPIVDLAEIWSDLDGSAVPLTYGDVHAGFWRPLVTMWPRVTTHLRDDKPLLVTGHSLGGVRAHLAPAVVADARPVEVVSFGAPKGANGGFWARWPQPLRIVHGRDFAPAWPFTGPWSQPPGDLMWLHDGAVDHIARRPGFNDSLGDHNVDLYAASLAGGAPGG